MGDKLSLLMAMLLSVCSLATAAEGYSAFAPMPKEYLSVPGEVVEVRNMPEVRDQGGFPECHAFAEWYALMHFQCKVEGKNCKHLDPKATPSPALLSIFNTDERAKLGIKEFRDAILFSAGGDPEKGQSFLYSPDDQPFPLYADSCFPMEQLLRKFGGDSRTMNAALNRLKTEYFDKGKKGTQPCVTCLLDTLRNEFDRQPTEATVRDALSKSSFDEFLFQVFVGECKATVTFPYSVSFNSLTRNSDDLSYERFLDVIGGKLGNDTPLLASVCLAEKVALTGKCSNGHILAITGLKKVCSNTQCDAYLKVLNTWGASWQKAKSDGWLDAKTLYDYVERLSWLEWMTHFEQLDAFQGRLDDKAKAKAVNRLLALASFGDANAQRDLAWFYFTGIGTAQNYEEAKKWYLKAAEFGDEEAQSRLGEMYIQGKGVPENTEEGVKWLKRSSGGNASRKIRLGLIYRDGKGAIAPDGKEAIKWLLAAATIGSPKAEFLIGQMYDEGIAVAVNKRDADKWYRLAASHGYEKAAEKLKPR